MKPNLVTRKAALYILFIYIGISSSKGLSAKESDTETVQSEIIYHKGKQKWKDRKTRTFWCKSKRDMICYAEYCDDEVHSDPPISREPDMESPIRPRIVVYTDYGTEIYPWSKVVYMGEVLDEETGEVDPLFQIITPR